MGAAPAPARTRAPDGARHEAGAHGARRTPRHRRARAPHAGVLRRRISERRALLRHGEGRRRHPADARRDGRVVARRGAPLLRSADRRDGRDPRGRLPRRGPRRVRAPRGLPRATGAALGRAVGALEVTGDPRDRGARAPAPRRAARVAPADDRARRLPPRQHDAGAERSGPDRRGARLGDGDARRPADRHGLVPRLLGTRPGQPRGFELGRHRGGFPLAR